MMTNDDSKDPNPPPTPPETVEIEDELKPITGSSILRVLLYDLWFRIAAVLILLVFLLLVLFLPKIWTSTPPDFLPVIRVSGLDKVQAGALRRSAEKFRAERKYPEALLAWQSAAQNDPGNPELARGTLRTLIEQPMLNRPNLGWGVDRSFWLLRLAHTNTADLSLVVRFLHHGDLDELAGQLIGTHVEELSPEALADALVVYFRLGQMDHFNELWQKHLQPFTNSPALRLHQIAWQAAWGPPVTLRPARIALEAAQNDANTDIARLAHQLQLVVSSSLGELARYESSLNWLEEHHFDRVADHINHWHMLVVSGQRARAQELARSFSQPPDGATDAAGMAAVYQTLGLDDYAVEFLEKQVREFPFYGQLWIQLAQLHINKKRWDEVRNTAVTIRNTTELRGELDGYSLYLSGLVELKQGGGEAAAATFAKIPSQRFSEPLLAYSVARELLHLGYGEISSKMLQKLEADYGDKATFWFDLTVAAYEAREMDVLETAARKAWEIEPNRIDIINNYAAALIVLRKLPDEAVKLTLSLVTSQPKRPEFKVNHALALLQNGRLFEAEDILKALNPTQLTVNDSAVADYGWFELAVHRGDADGVRKIYPTIQRSQLLPPQLEWLDAEYKKVASDAAK